MIARVLAWAVIVIGACSSSRPTAPPRPGDSAVLITDASQREGAVDHEVTIVGVQTRTKIPTVCGVDVDGAYALSDRRVIVRGVLRRTVVTEVDPMTANRGTGTFYSVIDPATGVLAKTAPRDE